MSYPALLGVCVSVGSEMLDRERTGYEITQRQLKTCLTTMRKHDSFIIYLFIYLFPSSSGSGKPISRNPTTILIGWGLCWRSLSFLYGLLKSSLNGVSLDSVTCSIFSGSSSSLVSPGILYFYEISARVKRLMLRPHIIPLEEPVQTIRLRLFTRGKIKFIH